MMIHGKALVACFKKKRYWLGDILINQSLQPCFSTTLSLVFLTLWETHLMSCK